MVMARSLSFPATLSRNSFMANHTLSSICYRSTSSLLSLFPYKIDPFGKTEMFSQNYFMRAPFLSTISWGGCSHSPRYIPIWSGWSTSWWRGWWQCLRSWWWGSIRRSPLLLSAEQPYRRYSLAWLKHIPVKKIIKKKFNVKQFHPPWLISLQSMRLGWWRRSSHQTADILASNKTSTLNHKFADRWSNWTTRQWRIEYWFWRRLVKTCKSCWSWRVEGVSVIFNILIDDIPSILWAYGLVVRGRKSALWERKQE